MKPGAHANKEAARLYAESLRDIIEPLRDRTTRQIASELNSQHFTTARGAPWSSMTISRLLRRLNCGKSENIP